jgi:hypothetical protein
LSYFNSHDSIVSTEGKGDQTEQEGCVISEAAIFSFEVKAVASKVRECLAEEHVY